MNVVKRAGAECCKAADGNRSAGILHVLILSDLHRQRKSMSFRILPIEVPPDAPFANDNLDRRQIVEFVSSIVTQTENRPLVLAIDSPYGTGKSTFVEMLNVTLTQQNFQTVHFNAWKADHVSDPLIAMVSALDKAVPRTPVSAETLDRVKAITGVVVKKAIVVGAKTLTAGLLDVGDSIEEALADAASDTASDIIGSFEKEQEAIEAFRSELGKVVAKLKDLEKKPPLVFFIDELDRCRPDFAMQLLERVKHMFDVPNLVFVLSVDKKQLEAVTAAVYGERIDAVEYLRKFIDLEFSLPRPAIKDFVKSTIKRAGLDADFNARSVSDKDSVVRFITFLATIYGMSLRSIERSIVRLKLVMATLPKNFEMNPAHVALLVVLRSIDKDMFDKMLSGGIGPMKALDHFRSLPHAGNRLESRDGQILEAVLISELYTNEQLEQYRQEQHAIMTNSQDRAAINAARQRMSLIDAYTQGIFGGSVFKSVAAMIDLASNVQD